MSVLEQTARMAPREAALTDNRTAELASTLRLVAQSEILLGKPDLSLPIVRRDLMELAERVEGMAKAEKDRDALRALIAEVVATKTSVRDVTYGHTVRRIPHELMDRLVAATRTTEGE